ncbi:MAG: peptide-methionine (S)-S-oxide reductase MsrA [Hyphomonadaceae bacterium]|jgi:peptide-methionine (S)-S-oxide reductase|nr:peptide-methionine (S)-S-oxide reductase MsrA [Hyphomonadaceae bacterium]
MKLSHPLRWLALVALLTGIPAAMAQTAPLKTDARTAVAIFAGGCFWCMEEAFEQVPGVITAVSGYIGGKVANPTYKQVSTGTTGHAEAVQITYDPARVSYPQLVDWFWRNIDPVDAVGQFCDKGSEYRSAIFYRDATQKKIAEESKQALQASGRLQQPIVTEITAAGPFYLAEDYHQDYYKKNANRYQFYKYGCRRVQRLEQIWGKATPPPNLTQ